MDWPDPGVLGSRNPSLPFHLGFKKSSNDRSSSRFGNVGVVPKAAGAGIGDERVEEAIGFDVIFPDMTAPPIFLFPDLGQDQIRRQRLGHSVIDKRLIGARSADEGVEIFDSSFVFGCDPAGVLGTSGGEKLHIDAELRLENRFQSFSQLGPRWNTGNDFALFFGLLQRPLPSFFQSLCPRRSPAEPRKSNVARATRLRLAFVRQKISMSFLLFYSMPAAAKAFLAAGLVR